MIVGDKLRKEDIRGMVTSANPTATRKALVLITQLIRVVEHEHRLEGLCLVCLRLPIVKVRSPCASTRRYSNLK